MDARRRRRLLMSTQEVPDVLLESSDEEDDLPLSDYSDLYQPPSSNSDSESSDCDNDSFEENADKPSHHTLAATKVIRESPLPDREDEQQDTPDLDSMKYRATDTSPEEMTITDQTETSLVYVEESSLPLSYPLPPIGSSDSMEYGITDSSPKALNDQLTTEMETILVHVEEFPLLPADYLLPPVSDDSDNFELPPPPSPLPPVENYDDFEFPPPPQPLIPIDNIATDKKLTRKRKRSIDDWEKRVYSKKHNTGQVKKFKGETSEKNMKSPCDKNCKRRCLNVFNKENRQQLFDTFWGMNSKHGRRDFIVCHIHELEKKRTIGKSDKRKRTLQYMLPHEGSVVQVCKKMFLSTLDISDAMVLYNLDQSVCNIVKPKPKSPPKNTIDTVKAHIESFPKVESHYCRSDSKRKYLDASLNIRHMHRLYCEKHTPELWVSEHKYREVFNKSYNLSFHHPSKDLCDTCTKFKLNFATTEDDKLNYEAHLRRKIQAREQKSADKADHSKVVAAFDLQQVISSPKLSISNAFYLRKLNIYNFTILNLQSLQGDCYTWTENECNRGANYIATCVTMWLQEKDHKGAKHVVFYSDCCGGQNRNRIMVSAICKFSCNSVSISKIEQKFFESGHSNNECDSMHSAIQNHYSKADVFLPSGFQQHMKQAQHTKPYNVHTLTHSDIKDFAKLNADHMKSSAFSGIQKVHHIVYQKNEITGANVLFSEEIGGDLDCKYFLKRGHTHTTFCNAILSHAYDAPCGIDDDKKRDLLKLCDYMPHDCRLYYNSL